MRRLSRFVIVLLAASLLLSGFAAPISAQADGDTDDIPIDVPDEYSGDTDTDTDEAADDDGEEGDASADGPEEDDADGGGTGVGDTGTDEDDGAVGGTPQVGGGDAIGSATPSAGDILDGAGEWAEEAAINTIGWVFEETMGMTVGAPTMENSGWLGIFGTPTAEPYAALFEDLHEAWIMPVVLSFVGFAVLWTGTSLPFSGLIGQYRASKWVSMTVILVFAIGLSWPIVSAMHAITDAVGTSFAPSAEELFGTEQGLETLGTAALPAAGGLYIFGWIKIMIYALIFGLRYFMLMMVMPFIFPLGLSMALAGPTRAVRAYGSSILSWHVILLVMGWPMALMFRAAYIVGWDFGLSGLSGILMVIGAIVAGVVIPIAMMRQAGRLSAALAGAAAGASTAVTSRDSYKPKTVGHAKRAGTRARDIGRSARSTASTAAQTVNKRVATDGGTVHESWGSGRSRGSSRGSSPSRASRGGGKSNTQAARKRAAARQRKTDGSGGGWRVMNR